MFTGFVIMFISTISKKTVIGYYNAYYRVMHYSAKRGLVVCPSVRLFVTLVDQDHIGGKSWNLIARTLSPTSSLFVAKRSSTYSQGNMEKFWGD